MIRHVASRRRSVSLLVAALVAVFLPLVVVPAVPAAAAQDLGVTQADRRLDDARGRVDGITRALDQTAQSYERANAHRVRLQDELVVSATRVQQAQAAVTHAEDQLSERVAAAYKHPTGDLDVSRVFVNAPDAASALHRAAMYRRLAASSAHDVDGARHVTTLTSDDARQERIVAAGAEASVDEWRRQAAALRDALATARTQVGAAEGALAEARAEAARRAEAQRRAAAARQATLALVSTTGAAPASLPGVDGMVCPVGQPNGFIDSWGYPRSGGRSHQGVDMFAAYGTPLYAVAEGVIYRVYTNPLGGLAINLIDTAGNMYYYAHLASASVRTGQTVHVGDTIGTVGTSGNAAGTPPHLHWQFHPGNGAAVNPYPLAYALCR